MPSITGIWMSIRITSKPPLRQASIAARPSPTITSSTSIGSTIAFSTFWLTRLSSAASTRTLRCCMSATGSAAVSLAACVAAPERQLDDEGRADAFLAHHRHLAAHQLGQLAADRQAEAGAAVLTRRRGVGLGELLEQGEDLVLRDADAGVGDRQPEAARIGRLEARRDAALVGELDRVGDQVGEDLAQPVGVAAPHARGLRRDLDREIQPLVVGDGARSRRAPICATFSMSKS